MATEDTYDNVKAAHFVEESKEKGSGLNAQPEQDGKTGCTFRQDP